MNNDHEVRRDAIINSACEQIRGLLETHFRDVCKAAEESFVGDENQSEPIAKIAVTVQFGAIAAATKVAVKCSWSIKHCDESEEEVDPLQSKLGLPDAEPKKHPFEDLRRDGMTVTIKTKAGETKLEPLPKKEGGK